MLAGRRDRFVLATKYGVSRDRTDPNAAGSHRKNLRPSLETSLRRLRTDYMDLYCVHVWDRLTPIEETMRALDDAVRAGKVLYVGISDTPAWVVARANTLAAVARLEPVRRPCRPATACVAATLNATCCPPPSARAERRRLVPAGRRRAVGQVHPPRRHARDRQPARRPTRSARTTMPWPGWCRTSPTSSAPPPRRWLGLDDGPLTSRAPDRRRAQARSAPATTSARRPRTAAGGGGPAGSVASRSIWASRTTSSATCRTSSSASQHATGG